MLSKTDYYVQNKDFTFAENIDRAWAVYINANQDDSDREFALGFLIYAFNIKETEDINAQLLPLMEQRNRFKAQNPEYIPGLAPRHVQLPPQARQVPPTNYSYYSTDPKLSSLLHSRELLDVNDKNKLSDRNYPNVQYFNGKQRAKYRVHIYQGKFCQSGKLFDTSEYEAHQKTTYAAFTLNANGELSVFNHRNVSDGIAHSSMNAGSPVVCAGELVIKDGELITINTHSGHYKPSLFSIFRALEYFSDKGIDISNTKVHLFKNPKEAGLELPVVPVTVGYMKKRFYEVPAVVFVSRVQVKLNQTMQNIQSDLKNYCITSILTFLYALKDWIIRSDLTEKREELANRVCTQLTSLVNSLSDDNVANSQPITEFVEHLQAIKQENENLSNAYGKRRESGRLQAKIEAFIEQAQSLIGMSIAALDDEVPKMKSTH